MNDFTKQKVNEEKYKKLREAVTEKYDGDFKSPHYKEINNNAVSQTEITEKETFNSDYKEDFNKASKDFWQKNTIQGLSKYNSGLLTGQFGKNEFTIDEVLERVGRFVKESITNELIEQKIPTEELTEHFKAIDSTLKLLSLSLKKMNSKIDIKNIAAFLHGFINAYIEDIIKRQIEREKSYAEKGNE